jgi:hypothetical protein
MNRNEVDGEALAKTFKKILLNGLMARSGEGNGF